MISTYLHYFCILGGGLYSKVGDSWNLRGIVSAMLINFDGSCNVNTFAVYTKVPDFFDWISDIVSVSGFD